jgi:hypothetical protein
MGWYPCCCKNGCEFCDCFPCGIQVKLDAIPPFRCSSSSLLPHDLFTGEWVYLPVTQNTPGSCRATKTIIIQDGISITIPPGPGTVPPPYACDPCSTSKTTIVEIEITIYPQANCNIPCTDADFQGASICQNCGWQYDVKIKVSPLVAGPASQTYEEWSAVAYQEIDDERCDLVLEEALSSGTRVCFNDRATTDYFNAINATLCNDGVPILDFGADIRMVIEPIVEYRNYAGVSCNGDPGCACWWQFNPVSPTSAPCTPTTDPSFVNCIDVTFNTGWFNIDYDDLTGAIPQVYPPGVPDGSPGLPCSDMDSFILKATDDVSGDFVPCYWSGNFTLNSTDPTYGSVIFMWSLIVIDADYFLFKSIPDSTDCPLCWDSKIPAYACSCPNIWQVQDGTLHPFTQYKFFLYCNQLYSGVNDSIAQFAWVSQNSFDLVDIWTSGAIAANPLKPYYALSMKTDSLPVADQNCSNTLYSTAQCTFIDPTGLTFPIRREEEFHCRSKHIIPDAIIAPVACPP